MNADGKTTITTTGGITSLAASPDGRRFAGASVGVPAYISIWDVESGTLVKRITKPVEQGFAPSQLAYSPDGMWILYASEMTCGMVHVETGEERFPQEFPAAPSLVLFPRSTLVLALFHEDDVHRRERDDVPQRLRIWNWRTSQLLCDQLLPIDLNTPLTVPAISPDESFVTFGWGHYFVRYELSIADENASLGRRSVFERGSRYRGPLSFTADAKYAAANMKNNECIAVFFDVESASIVHRLNSKKSEQWTRCNLAFTADGHGIVAAEGSGRVALWSFPNGELVTELGRFETAGNNNPPEISVTRGNRLIVAGGYADSRLTIQQLPPLTDAARKNVTPPTVTPDEAAAGPPASPQGAEAIGADDNGESTFEAAKAKVTTRNSPRLKPDPGPAALTRRWTWRGILPANMLLSAFQKPNRLLDLPTYELWFDPEALAVAQVNLKQSIQTDVENGADADHLRAICDELGVDFRVDGNVIRLFPKQGDHGAPRKQPMLADPAPSDNKTQNGGGGGFGGGGGVGGGQTK